VVRQGGRRQPDPPGDFARRQAARPFLDKKAKHLQPVLLSERGEGSNGSTGFHISTILEVTRHVNDAERIFYRLSCDMTNSKMSLMQGEQLAVVLAFNAKREKENMFSAMKPISFALDARVARPFRQD
jgi:hypothetical protein